MGLGAGAVTPISLVADSLLEAEERRAHLWSSASPCSSHLRSVLEGSWLSSRMGRNAFVFFYKFIYLFIFGCVGSSLLHVGFSLVGVSGGYSSLRCAGFSLRWLLLLRSTGSRHAGFSSCGTWA